MVTLSRFKGQEKAEEELGKFVEIRDAELKAANEEIIAAQEHAQSLEQALEYSKGHDKTNIYK
ncbi:hypothetical protein [Rivularia sp. PCC 7116]|uniref:hypothetical protein n=1 Tax=Rivularia sp. PCC 7116 TaxID=373994 RepID=UPI00030FDB20|nr:hypothetical protein [Rivularia sp. PCC 7116]